MNQKSVNNLINIYQHGNHFDKQKASNELWILYEDWVEKIVGNRCKKKSRANFEEMVNESCVAFYNAVKTYDLTRSNECSLKSHAAYWVNGFLNSYLRAEMHNNYVVPRCPYALRQRLYECSEGRNSISAADKKAIAVEFNTPYERVAELEQFFCASENTRYDEEESLLAKQAEELCHSDKLKLREYILSFVEKQSTTNASILERRWLKEKKDPYKKLAKIFEISYEKVRHVEIRAFNQLLRELKDEALVI